MKFNKLSGNMIWFNEKSHPNKNDSRFISAVDKIKFNIIVGNEV